MIVASELATIVVVAGSLPECDGPDAIALSCGYYFFSVEGWAEYAALDGTVQPVRRLRVFSDYYNDGAFDGELWRIKAKTRRSGFFKFLAAVSHSTHDGCKNGKPYHDEIYLKEHYLLRIQGMR